MENKVTIKSIYENLSKDVDELIVKIDFDTLQKSFEAIVDTFNSLKRNNLPIVPYLRDRMGFSQWQEDITLSHQPTKICAAGPIIAWCNQRKPNSFYFYNYNGDENRFIKGGVNETISCFDLSPKGFVLAIGLSKSIILWDTIHNRAFDKISFESTKSCITALSFFRNNKIVIGRDDGVVQTLCVNKKKSVAVKITNKALAIVARAPGGVTIVYDNDGNLKTYKRFNTTKAQCKVISSLKSGSDSLFPLKTVIPFGSTNFLASDFKGAVRCFKANDSSSFCGIKIKDAGTLIGLTAFDTFITRASTAQNIRTRLPVFRHYNFEGTLLEEVPMLESAQPILQKSNTRKFVKRSNWVPKFLMYEATQDKWILLIKQKDTVKQLAYKLMLAQAYKEKNFQAVEALLEHSMIHSFGKYTQKLLKAIYREPERDGKIKKQFSLNNADSILL